MLTANKGFLLGYTNEGIHVQNNVPAIIFDDFTMESKYVDVPFSVRSSAIKILNSRDKNVLFFCYLLLSSQHFPSLGHARHYISYVQKRAVFIPSIDEQTQISNLFKTLDSMIAAAQRQKSLLKHKKQAYLQQIFQLGMRIFQHCASKDLLTHGSNESCPMRRRLLWVRHLKAVHIRMNHLNMYLFKEIRISKMEQSFPGIGRHKKHAKFHQGQYCLAFELRLELSRVPVLMWFLVEVSQE